MKEEFEILQQLENQKKSVPENYFEDLSNNVLNQLGEQDKKSTAKVININFAWFAAAASIVLFLTINEISNLNSPITDQNTTLVSSVETEDDYLDFLVEIDDLDLSDIDIDIDEL